MERQVTLREAEPPHPEGSRACANTLYHLPYLYFPVVLSLRPGMQFRQ
jgi:hypothetical protein